MRFSALSILVPSEPQKEDWGDMFRSALSLSSQFEQSTPCGKAGNSEFEFL